MLTDSLESLYVRWIWGRGPIDIGPIDIGPIDIGPIDIIEDQLRTKRNADGDKINGKYVVGDPLTQLKLIK